MKHLRLMKPFVTVSLSIGGWIVSVMTWYEEEGFFPSTSSTCSFNSRSEAIAYAKDWASELEIEFKLNEGYHNETCINGNGVIYRDGIDDSN